MQIETRWFWSALTFGLGTGLSLDAGCQQYEDILQRHCGVKDIPESAYTIYTSRVARMRILRLTYGW